MTISNPANYTQKWGDRKYGDHDLSDWRLDA